MKAMSEQQARNCEEALLPRCRCRCGGALHGAKRGGNAPSRSFYEALPENDLHRLKEREGKDMYTVYSDIKIECPECKVTRTWDNLKFHIMWANQYGCKVQIRCKFCLAVYRITNRYGWQPAIEKMYWTDIPF